MESFALNEQVLLHIRRISRSMDVYSRKLATEHQLTAPQLICLRYLLKDNGITPSQLAKQVALSQATVTGILDRLASRRLVQRRRNPHDKRRVVVKITASGKRLVEETPFPLPSSLLQLLGTNEQEGERVLNVLRDVADRMEALDEPASREQVAPG